MAWVLIPSLVALRAEFNRRAPNRDKRSDGSIGDTAHSWSASDHNADETGRPEVFDADSTNEVHAIDVDEDLRARDARGAFTMMRAVRQLVADHRAGREHRLRYIIYERTIWAASWGWTARAYTGGNPHDHHAHFSGSYVTARERDARPWNIGWVAAAPTPPPVKPTAEEADMPLSDADLTAAANKVWAAAAPEYADEAGDGRRDARTAKDILWATHAIALRTAAEARLRDAAILEAIQGAGDSAAVLVRVETLAGQLAQQATAEAIRDADLRTLLEQHQAGDLDANAVVDALARRLTPTAGT